MISEIFTDTTDTICAISTPAGAGGIAVVRISGNDALSICQHIWRGKALDQAPTHTAHLGLIIDPADSSTIDQAVATIFKGPKSFTGEDTVELSIHGSKWIQRRVLELLTSVGARLALPGEFTRRAFVNGRLDLAEAEAVADLIASSSRAAHRMAISQLSGQYSKRIADLRAKLLELASLLELELDFSEEDVEFASRLKLRQLTTEAAQTLRKLSEGFSTGQALKEGIPVAIAGHTNVGKSSILNALAGDDRAIVSDIHGTTRDIVEDTVEIGNFLVRFRDTAGLRNTDDPIEKIGIERSLSAMKKAQAVIYVIDRTAPATIDQIRTELDGTDSAAIIFVENKTDICTTPAYTEQTLSPHFPSAALISLSAHNSADIDVLKTLIDKCLQELTDTGADITVTNIRHARAMTDAADSLDAAAAGLDAGIPPELTAQDLRQALYHLSSITGQISTPEILQSIFQNFCIGK